MNTLLLLAQGAASMADSLATANPVLTPVDAPAEMNMLDMAVKGGWIMIVLAVLSVGCFYILFERMYAIRKANKEDPMFMDKIKDYVTESNYIFEQVVKNEDKVDDNKGEYISRLITIKKGMENTNTSFLFEKYKKIKISSIELLIDLINENNEKDKNNYLKLVLKSNDRSQRELDSMMNKGFIEVTYLCLKTYINL